VGAVEVNGDENEPAAEPAKVNQELEPSRLAQAAEGDGISEVLYTPPGNHNQDPGDGKVQYAVLRMSRQVVGVIWTTPLTGAAGFFPATSAGDLGRNYAGIWADRITQARIRYALAEEEWDVVAWLDYWLERFGGQGAALEGPLAADYDELQQRMAQT